LCPDRLEWELWIRRGDLRQREASSVETRQWLGLSTCPKCLRYSLTYRTICTCGKRSFAPLTVWGRACGVGPVARPCDPYATLENAPRSRMHPNLVVVVLPTCVSIDWTKRKDDMQPSPMFHRSCMPLSRALTIESCPVPGSDILIPVIASMPMAGQLFWPSHSSPLGPFLPDAEPRIAHFAHGRKNTLKFAKCFWGPEARPTRLQDQLVRPELARFVRQHAGRPH